MSRGEGSRSRGMVTLYDLVDKCEFGYRNKSERGTSFIHLLIFGRVIILVSSPLNRGQYRCTVTTKSNQNGTRGTSE